jgi:hypothetical protein
MTQAGHGQAEGATCCEIITGTSQDAPDHCGMFFTDKKQVLCWFRSTVH